MEFMLQILMSAEGFYSAQRCSCFIYVVADSQLLISIFQDLDGNFRQCDLSSLRTLPLNEHKVEQFFWGQAFIGDTNQVTGQSQPSFDNTCFDVWEICSLENFCIGGFILALYAHYFSQRSLMKTFELSEVAAIPCLGSASIEKHSSYTISFQ